VLWQVSGLMGVAMCMYAGIGTQLFSFVKRGTSGGITRQVNFGSFGNTFLVLFQIMTSEHL
jgi:Ion transport protein